MFFHEVIDNVVSLEYQQYIQNVIYEMMWAYKANLSSNTVFADDEKFVNVPGFSKLFYRGEVLNQLLYNTAMPLAHISCSKIGYEMETDRKSVV